MAFGCGNFRRRVVPRQLRKICRMRARRPTGNLPQYSRPENVKTAMGTCLHRCTNDRAIASSRAQGLYPLAKWRLSAGIQRMVRSDSGVSGVMFTIDTELVNDGIHHRIVRPGRKLVQGRSTWMNSMCKN